MNNSIFKGLALAGTLMVNNMQGYVCSICGQSYGKVENRTIKGWCRKCCKICGNPLNQNKDQENNKVQKEWCGKCCKICGEHQTDLVFGQYCDKCNEVWQIHKEEWQLTVDFIMIVGKYFKTPQDFINAMKVCKKYK